MTSCSFDIDKGYQDYRHGSGRAHYDSRYKCSKWGIFHCSFQALPRHILLACGIFYCVHNCFNYMLCNMLGKDAGGLGYIPIIDEDTLVSRSCCRAECHEGSSTRVFLSTKGQTKDMVVVIALLKEKNSCTRFGMT